MSTTTATLFRRTFGVCTVTMLLFASCGAEPDAALVVPPFRRRWPPTRPARI
jgi:hypothetical protein